MRFDCALILPKTKYEELGKPNSTEIHGPIYSFISHIHHQTFATATESMI